jgi:uncharacterized membrane protein YvbJ
MTTCPKCNRQVSETAKECPQCGEDFAARRQQEAIGHALSLALLVALLGFALVVVLLPGIIINTLRGRYKDRPNHILRASIADWQTWAIALPMSAIIIATLRLAGVL